MSPTSDWRYEKSPNLPGWAYDTSAAYIILVCSAGIACNLAVVVAFVIRREVSFGGSYFIQASSPCLVAILFPMQIRSSPGNWLIFSLVCSEVLVSAVALPVDASTALARGWRMSEAVCEATGFLVTFGGRCQTLNSF